MVDIYGYTNTVFYNNYKRIWLNMGLYGEGDLTTLNPQVSSSNLDAPTNLFKDLDEKGGDVSLPLVAWHGGIKRHIAEYKRCALLLLRDEFDVFRVKTAPSIEDSLK